VIIFFAILGVLSQSNPLRVCAAQKQATGTNCHEHLVDHDRPVEDEGGDHGPCDRGESCQCQLPRVDADKAKSAPMPNLLPPLLATLAVAGKSDVCSLGMVAAPARPPDTPRTVPLPLLN
jgi:hypothetical protein